MNQSTVCMARQEESVGAAPVGASGCPGRGSGGRGGTPARTAQRDKQVHTGRCEATMEVTDSSGSDRCPPLVLRNLSMAPIITCHNALNVYLINNISLFYYKNNFQSS